MPSLPDLLIAVLGWSTIPLVILRFQVRDFTRGLWIGAAAGWASALYMTLLGIPAGAIIALTVAVTISLQAGFGNRLPASFRYAIAMTAIAIAVWLKEPGLIAFLPVIAFAMTRLAEARQHDLALRLTMLFASALWVIYGADANAWPVVVGNMISICSNVWGIWRFYLRASTCRTST